MKVLRRRLADSNNVVLTISGPGGAFQKRPCEECPWRRDVKAGAFPAEAFRITAHVSYDMASKTFACHMAGAKAASICAGFLHVSLNNLTVRMLFMKGQLAGLEEPKVQLYSSYREMAEANGVAPSDPSLRESR